MTQVSVSLSRSESDVELNPGGKSGASVVLDSTLTESRTSLCPGATQSVILATTSTGRPTMSK